MDDKQKEMYNKIKDEYAATSEKILKIIENHKSKKETAKKSNK